jgi:hypothetical protein
MLGRDLPTTGIEYSISFIPIAPPSHVKRSHYAIGRLLYNVQYIRSKDEDELLCVGFAKKDFSPLLVKGLCGRYLSEFIDWRYSKSCWYFLPSFVNCFPSNLLSGRCSSVWGPEPHIPSLTHCIRVLYTVYFLTQGRGEGGELNQREG